MSSQANPSVEEFGNYVPNWCDQGFGMTLPDGWNWYRCQGCGNEWGTSNDPLDADLHAEMLREHFLCTISEIDVVTGQIVA